jgi:hypothetical protein
MLLAALLALALAGCEMRAEVNVNEDGSGSIGIVMGMEPFVANALPAGESDPFTEFENALTESDVPWHFERFTEPGLSGVRATVPFTSMTDLQDVMRRVADDPAAGGGGFGDTFDLQRGPDGGWQLRATTAPPEGKVGTEGSGLVPTYQDPTFPAFPEQPGGLVGTAPAPGDTFDFDPQQYQAPDPLESFRDFFRFEFHVTLPGKATGTNASDIERTGRSTTFIWRLDPGHDAPDELLATTAPLPPAIPYVPIGLALVVAAVAVKLVRRRTPRLGGPPPVVLEGFIPSPTSMDAGGDLLEPAAVADLPPADETGQQTLAV